MVVSAVILFLVSGSVISLFVQSMDSAGRVDFQYTAFNLAKNRVEFAQAVIANDGFSALTNAAFGEADTRLDSSGVPNATGAFFRSTVVTLNFSANARLTRVDVTVDYLYRGNLRQDAASISTVFADI